MNENDILRSVFGDRMDTSIQFSEEEWQTDYTDSDLAEAKADFFIESVTRDIKILNTYMSAHMMEEGLSDIIPTVYVFMKNLIRKLQKYIKTKLKIPKDKGESYKMFAKSMKDAHGKIKKTSMDKVRKKLGKGGTVKVNMWNYKESLADIQQEADRLVTNAENLSKELSDMTKNSDKVKDGMKISIFDKTYTIKGDTDISNITDNIEDTIEDLVDKNLEGEDTDVDIVKALNIYLARLNTAATHPVFAQASFYNKSADLIKKLEDVYKKVDKATGTSLKSEDVEESWNSNRNNDAFGEGIFSSKSSKKDDTNKDDTNNDNKKPEEDKDVFGLGDDGEDNNNTEKNGNKKVDKKVNENAKTLQNIINYYLTLLMKYIDYIVKYIDAVKLKFKKDSNKALITFG